MPPPRRARRLLITLGAACALALAGCAHAVDGSPVPSHVTPSTSAAATGSTPSGASSAPAAPSVPRATYDDCSNLVYVDRIPVPSALKGKIKFGCATVSVPLDYAHPDGAHIDIQLFRVHDSDNTGGLGSLLVNPGGPGASGIDLAVGLLTEVSPKVLKDFDMVGFDPRGVGFSSPIECLTDRQKDEYNAFSPDVLTASGFAQARAMAKRVANDCSAKYGNSLPFYNTVNTARDMDLIRQAVGDDTMNYLGFSYGTELGSIYAHLFPDKVRVAVLDGAVDPTLDDVTSFADQVQGFEMAFDQFASRCQQKPSSCPGLRQPRGAVMQVVRAAQSKPLSTGQSRKLTSSLALTGVLNALYSQAEWPELARAITAAQSGDGSRLLTLADEYYHRYDDGTYDNLIDANLAISCNDAKPGLTAEQIRHTAQQWAQQYPMFGAWSAASLFGCQQWQPDRTPVPMPRAATPGTVLVVGNLHDPATPYAGAKHLATAMGNAQVLTWDGEGHTSYLQGSSCIDNAVNSYLLERELPPVGEVCPR